MSLFSLQKTLALLVMPAGLFWLLLMAVTLLVVQRKQRVLGAFLLFITLLYGCAGNVILGGALMAKLEAGIPPVNPLTTHPYEAVFVLGGGSEEDPLGLPEFSLSGDRIALAARLWHAGKAGVLVASGVVQDSRRGPRDTGAETRALWLGLGIPASAILTVGEPCRNTREEIAAYVRLRDRHGWQNMGLVSSASHLPRALALANKAGLVVTPLGADWRGRPRTFQLQDLVPQANGFLDTQRACWEYLGRWMGR